MCVRGFALSFAALLAFGALSTTAEAGQRNPPPPPDYVEEYSGPPIIRHIPGLRILFGDYALSEEEFDALYGQKKKRVIDESYYEPQPAAPKAKRQTPQKKPATAAKPATADKAAPAQQPAKSTQASAAMSCEKATTVVSGYGFSSVEAASCSGKLYAFNAKRDGKSFAIKVDPASGQLTEVKKLP